MSCHGLPWHAAVENPRYAVGFHGMPWQARGMPWALPWQCHGMPPNIQIMCIPCNRTLNFSGGGIAVRPGEFSERYPARFPVLLRRSSP